MSLTRKRLNWIQDILPRSSSEFSTFFFQLCRRLQLTQNDRSQVGCVRNATFSTFKLKERKTYTLVILKAYRTNYLIKITENYRIYNKTKNLFSGHDLVEFCLSMFGKLIRETSDSLRRSMASLSRCSKWSISCRSLALKVRLSEENFAPPKIFLFDWKESQLVRLSRLPKFESKTNCQILNCFFKFFKKTQFLQKNTTFQYRVQIIICI
jgi:hypothetical protein